MLNFIEHAQKLISIPSISKDGNEDISCYLQNLMEKMGIKTSLQDVTHSVEGVSKKQFNILGVLGDPLVDTTTKKGLLLNTHIDTVGPGLKSNWTECNGEPFRLQIKEDKLYGLGTADVKLDFLCKLKAVEKFKDRRLKMPIYLVATAGEEIGMLGAKYLIKSKALNPKYVLVGEPSELGVVYAHKAYLVYQIQIQFHQKEKDAKGYNTRIHLQTFGKAAHGSYPHLGDNAIDKSLNILQKIIDAKFQMRLSRMSGGESVNKVPDQSMVEFFLTSSGFEDFRKFYKEKLADSGAQVEFGGVGESGLLFLPSNLLELIQEIRTYLNQLKEDFSKTTDNSFNPATSTFNLGKVESDQNSIKMHLDVRLLPNISKEEFDAAFKARIQQINSKFPDLIVKVERKRFNPSLNMNIDHDLIKSAQEAQKLCGIQAGLDKKATSTEAAQYFEAGFDAFVFGPGKSQGNSHSPNEYNLVDHLDKAIHFYERMIERYCI
jgi:acetylornithine deacetylase/succinyl-diaminopimelate desuccinylase-like protein